MVVAESYIGNGQFTDSPGPLTAQPASRAQHKVVVIATCMIFFYLTR